MKRLVIALTAAALAAVAAQAEESKELEKIVVTPSRLMTELGESSRSVAILGGARLEYSVYRDIPDTIAETGGIDVRRRGPYGVQSDISIRGTTFEQNAALIDGVRVNDPQTGHFNTDWPVTMMDLDRVEIVKGPASSLYGPNAFGGVVNVVTKKPVGESFLAYGEGGSHDYADFGASNTVSFGPASNRFSIEERRSTGYTSETQFDILTLTETAALRTCAGDYEFLFGYMYKDFGASDFYSNIYPNEDERTETRFFKLSGEIESGPLKLSPDLYLRRHWDKFALDANRPGWQTNYHTAYDYGFDIDCALENGFIDTAFGYELYRDTIDSTNLQTHSRTVDGLYLEVSPHLADGLYLNAGLREDYFGDFGWQCSPSVSASLALQKHLTVRGVIGRSYRVPTFTDLYYNDAANRGDPALRPESCWSYEAGFDCDMGCLAGSATYFHRHTSDSIDWIRRSSRSAWQASNIGTAVTNGAEASARIPVGRLLPRSCLKALYIDYTVVDTVAKHDYISKYALDYLKQHISAGAECGLAGFRNYWTLNYRKRVGGDESVVVDMKISKEIVRKKELSFEAYLEISNLFNEKYTEQSGVSMPGRWIKSGARLAF
jgi:iron complex outermembrane receptor protein